MPALDAAPTPRKYASGTLITRAHGQLITRNVIAVTIQYFHEAPITSGGTIATRSASAHTIGV